MTIQQLVYAFKKDGMSDERVKIAVFAFLEHVGHPITRLTHLVIEKHCKNWSNS